MLENLSFSAFSKNNNNNETVQQYNCFEKRVIRTPSSHGSSFVGEIWDKAQLQPQNYFLTKTIETSFKKLTQV